MIPCGSLPVFRSCRAGYDSALRPAGTIVNRAGSADPSVGTVMKSIAIRIGRLIAAAIQQPASSGYPCLDQHYAANGQPTTMVFGIPYPCHWSGNQQWLFEPVAGTSNSYRIVNYRSTFTPNVQRWCLSHPNQGGTRVYTEQCVDALRFKKQLWTPRAENQYGNLLQNEGTGYCLLWNGDYTLWGYPCNRNIRALAWRWAGTPM